MSDIAQAFEAPVYGGGAPSAAELAAWAYRFHRATGRTAADALQRARADAEAGKRRYPSAAHPGGWSPECDGARWVESLPAAGLRFVGYADEIAGLRHRGWYTEDDGLSGETLRGAVLQLPAHDGRARYLAAYEDPNNANAYRVDVSHVFTAEPAYPGPFTPGDFYGAHRDAAYAADSLAERVAEQERDYNRAWQVGSQWAQLGEDIAAERTDALAILAERRAVKGVEAPALCAAIRAQLARHLQSIRDARKRRQELADSVWRKYYAAFNEGAGETVLV